MAKYDVDGVIVEANSPQEAAGKASGAQSAPQTGGSLFDTLMQGLTLGYADELGGLGARLGSWAAGAPEERRDLASQNEMARQRKSIADVRERMPLAALGTELGGAIVSGGPLAKGLQAGFRGMGVGNMLAPIMSAGIEGSIAGAGASDEDRVLGGTVGALLGGTMAGAMPLVGGLAQKGSDKISPLIRRAFEGPETTAGRVLSEFTEGAGETPTRLRARQRQLGPQATFADVAGSPGQTLGQGVIQADKSGQALSTARREMAKRGAGSTRRIKEDLRGITGIDKNLQESIDEVVTRQREAAGPAYDLAREQEIALTPKLEDLLSRPTIKKAVNEAKAAAADSGDELPTFFKIADGEMKEAGVIPDMASWDMIKRSLDDLIEGEQDALTRKLTPKGRRMNNLKKELLGELDRENPDYAKAREIFAGDQVVVDAMKNGESFLNMKPREVKQAMEGATKSEKDAFMTGAMESIRDKMGRARSGEIGEFRFLETGNTREKLRAMFPDGREGDQQLAELMRTLDRERTFASTQGSLVGGSQTAMRQAAGDAVKSGASLPTTLEALSNPATALLQASMKGADEAVSGLGQKSVNKLGQMMFDPNQTNRAILEMERRGIKPVDMEAIMASWARGGANIAPILGLGAGNMTNQ